MVVLSMFLANPTQANLNINFLSVIADTQPQAEYVPAETTARPTPAPIIPDYDYNEPIVEVTEEPVGYNYPVPEVTLPIRPVTTTQVWLECYGGLFYSISSPPEQCS